MLWAANSCALGPIAWTVSTERNPSMWWVFRHAFGWGIDYVPFSSWSVARRADVAGYPGETGKTEIVWKIPSRDLFAAEQADLG